jgi:hypothetical protein
MMLKLRHFGKQVRNSLETFEMWCWRRTEKIVWTDHLRNEEVLHRVEEERNILHTIKRRKDRGARSDGKTGQKYKQLLDDLKEMSTGN